jgi:hypothetical protein
VDIVALGGEAGGLGERVALGEVTAIRNASGDGEAPLTRGERELRRREDVPQNERPAKVGVARVAAIVGQRELARSECAIACAASRFSAGSGLSITSEIGFARDRMSTCPVSPASRTRRPSIH